MRVQEQKLRQAHRAAIGELVVLTLFSSECHWKKSAQVDTALQTAGVTTDWKINRQALFWFLTNSFLSIFASTLKENTNDFAN